MKITAVWERWIAEVNLRSAWDISRACSPMCESPMSPSISAWGTKAATLSMMIESMAPLRTNCSVMSSACSALSGWAMSRLSTFRPQCSA